MEIFVSIKLVGRWNIGRQKTWLFYWDFITISTYPWRRSDREYKDVWLNIGNKTMGLPPSFQKLGPKTITTFALKSFELFPSSNVIPPLNNCVFIHVHRLVNFHQ